jgi:hypothetical protein
MRDENDSKTAALPLPSPGEDAAAAPRGRGRPRQYADAAARQRAYRERLRERGMRTVQRVVRDVRGDAPLTSDVIDLSEVRQR